MRTLVGHALMLAGLALAVAGLLVSGEFPSVPLGVVVAAACLVGAPPVLIGARLVARGEQPTLPPAQFEAGYPRATFRFAAALGVSAALAGVLVAPMIVMGGGLAPWDGQFLAIWAAGWCVAVRLGCRRVIRPLHAAAERVALSWYDRRNA
ncbi:MAG: hypothetical protein K2V38_28430 [Gemmataceae bacterium]|nr:hypothetical protein [Gemmataceae bacterium]